MGEHDDTARREAEFHDEWARSVDPASVDVAAVWKGIGCPEVTWIADRLGDVSGKRLLDLGSGLGEASVWFAMQGADVTAFDVSPQMLDVVRDVATLHGVAVKTVVGDAEDLSGFDEGSFDIVYGANVLHHVDIAKCLDGVHRVLTTGGRAAFWDPVKYNPVIEMYRALAMEVRTHDEHPLRRSDLRTMERRFSTVEVRGFWLTGLLLFARFFFIDRIPPNDSRYWKLAIERQDEHRRFLLFSSRLDRRLMGWIPGLRWVCWNMGVVCTR